MKIILAGGSGQVGTILARYFHNRGDEVINLSRNPSKAEWRTVHWDAFTQGPWIEELSGADIVINLAGRSVNCRYNKNNRELIKNSRVNSTRVIGEAITSIPSPPRLLLQSSTATIYAHSFDKANDEVTGVIGGKEVGVPETWRFSIDVALSWERAIDEFALPNTRVVKMRSAMIMSPDKYGVFDTLLRLVRFGLGGKSGDGKQFVSWIHDIDFIRAIEWIVENEHISGAVNLSSPNPLPNNEFMRELRKAWGISVGLPATKLMLEMGAIFLKTETELVLKSRRVVPGLLLKDGFTFEFPMWSEAAKDICKRWYSIGK